MMTILLQIYPSNELKFVRSDAHGLAAMVAWRGVAWWTFFDRINYLTIQADKEHTYFCHNEPHTYQFRLPL